MKSIQVGIVGCGENSDNHLRVYSKTKGVKIIAICDRKLNKAKLKAHQYGVRHIFTEFDSMLKLDLDLIDIITPTPTHARLSQLALESGSNVLVEKPMAINVKESLAMINAARKNDRTLCILHNKLFYDSVIQTKSIINNEELSVSRMRISHYSVHNNSQDRDDWRMTNQAGGILFESLVHDIYLFDHFIGPIKSVYAVGERIRKQTYDSFTLFFKNMKKVGICEYEWNTKEPFNEFQLLTGEGDRFHGNLTHDYVLRRSRDYGNRGFSALRSLQDDIVTPFIKWRRLLQNFIKIRSYPGALPDEKTFYAFIRNYLSYLRAECPSPPILAKDGLVSIKILESIRQSLDSGKAQNI